MHVGMAWEIHWSESPSTSAHSTTRSTRSTRSTRVTYWSFSPFVLIVLYDVIRFGGFPLLMAPRSDANDCKRTFTSLHVPLKDYWCKGFVCVCVCMRACLHPDYITTPIASRWLCYVTVDVAAFDEMGLGQVGWGNNVQFAIVAIAALHNVAAHLSSLLLRALTNFRACRYALTSVCSCAHLSRYAATPWNNNLILYLPAGLAVTSMWMRMFISRACFWFHLHVGSCWVNHDKSISILLVITVSHHRWSTS